MIKYYDKLLLSLSEIKGHPSLLIHGYTGCPFHCFHCFNYDEIVNGNPKTSYKIDDVLHFIKRQEQLYEFIILSGGEYLKAPLEHLKKDLSLIKETSNKPIIVYTTGVELEKMKILTELGLIDGFHIDMKLPYHLLNEDDFDLVELTMGVALKNLKLFDTLLNAIEFVVAYDKGFSRVRSVKYPFLSPSAFDANRMFIHQLNHRYGKNVPYDVNPFVYAENSTATA